MTPTHTADWVWPIRWDAARMEASVLANLPALAAHRELDRLSSLAWDAHRGEPGAETRLQDAVRNLHKAASWLPELARAVEADPRRPCGCDHAMGRAAPQERATESPGAGATQISHGGYLDDGGLSVLLAVVSGVVGDEACDVVIGLAAAAIAAEAALADATPTQYAGRPSDVAMLAGRGDVPILPATMQLLSGSLPGVPGLPGLGGSGGIGGIGGQKPPSGGGLVPGKNPWVTGKTPWEIIKPGRDPELVDHRPVTPPWLDPLEVIDRDGVRRIACLLALKKLLTPEPPPPRLPPGAPVVWTSGITSVSVVNPCGAAPRLTLRGGPFGATQPAGVGVVAPQWNAARKQVVCRPVDVLSWSDTEVAVQLPDTAVGGVAGFADIAYIAAYDAWVERENTRVRAILDAAACAGTEPPPGLVIRHPWSDCPPVTAGATYAAGGAKLVVELVPANGVVTRWRKDLVRLSPGESFWVHWSSANATTVHRSEPAPGGTLAAAGHPSSGNVAASGSVLLTAPSGPRRVKLTFVASNACRAVTADLEAVVVSPPLEQPLVFAVAPIPGGDVNVVNAGGGETLQPAGRSIPLVAGKRTVIRLDWQLAVPIAPAGDEVIVTSTVWAKVPSYPSGSLTTELRAQSDTSKPPPAPADPPVELQPTEIFTADRQMFSFVLPASIAVGDVTLTAYITARSPGTAAGGDDIFFYYSASTTIRFHSRRAVRFRYERWTSATSPAPSDAECTNALRMDGALLPFPDPPITALFAAPRMSNTLVEDLFALKSNTPGASGKEEIWFTMGDWGTGGVALSSTPWVAASEPAQCVSAHEVGHMFKQNHIDHPACGPDDGEDPTTFPDAAQVVVVGWDGWNNKEIVGAVDLMTYCWGNSWMSPERWRRMFVGVGL